MELEMNLGRIAPADNLILFDGLLLPLKQLPETAESFHRLDTAMSSVRM